MDSVYLEKNGLEENNGATGDVDDGATATGKGRGNIQGEGGVRGKGRGRGEGCCTLYPTRSVATTTATTSNTITVLQQPHLPLLASTTCMEESTAGLSMALDPKGPLMSKNTTNFTNNTITHDDHHHPSPPTVGSHKGKPITSSPCSTHKNELPMAQKVNLIEEYESHNTSQRALATKYRVSRATVVLILKQRDRYVNELDRRRFMASISPSASKDKTLNHINCQNLKRMRKTNISTLNSLMEDHVREQHHLKNVLSGPKLKEKAKEIAITLGLVDFKASNGWLDAFKKRCCLDFSGSHIASKQQNNSISWEDSLQQHNLSPSMTPTSLTNLDQVQSTTSSSTSPSSPASSSSIASSLSRLLSLPSAYSSSKSPPYSQSHHHPQHPSHQQLQQEQEQQPRTSTPNSTSHHMIPSMMITPDRVASPVTMNGSSLTHPGSPSMNMSFGEDSIQSESSSFSVLFDMTPFGDDTNPSNGWMNFSDSDIVAPQSNCSPADSSICSSLSPSSQMGQSTPQPPVDMDHAMSLSMSGASVVTTTTTSSSGSILQPQLPHLPDLTSTSPSSCSLELKSSPSSSYCLSSSPSVFDQHAPSMMIQQPPTSSGSSSSSMSVTMKTSPATIDGSMLPPFPSCAYAVPVTESVQVPGICTVREAMDTLERFALTKMPALLSNILHIRQEVSNFVINSQMTEYQMGSPGNLNSHLTMSHANTHHQFVHLQSNLI